MTTYWASSGKVNRSLPTFQRYGTDEYQCEYKFRLVSPYFFVYHQDANIYPRHIHGACSELPSRVHVNTWRDGIANIPPTFKVSQ